MKEICFQIETWHFIVGVVFAYLLGYKAPAHILNLKKRLDRRTAIIEQYEKAIARLEDRVERQELVGDDDF